MTSAVTVKSPTLSVHDSLSKEPNSLKSYRMMFLLMGVAPLVVDDAARVTAKGSNPHLTAPHAAGES